MTKRAAAQRKDHQQESQDPLPAVLVSPSRAEPHQRDAYWLELLQDAEKFKDAVQTEDLWPMLKSFPEALWGDRITIFIYRLPDDDGVMVKNAEGQAKYIKPVVRFCIDEDWVANKHGGGKYQIYLKLDDVVIRKHTFRIDGEPKVQAGQTVEVQGKTVSIGAAAAPAAPDTRSDVATIIDANSRAEEKRTEMLLSANKASIELVKEQAVAAAKPDAASGIMEKMMTVMIDRMMNPPPVADPIDTFVKLQGLIQKPNPEHEPQHETQLDETLGVLQKLTGKDSIADLLRPSVKAAAEDNYGWVAPVVGAVTNFIDRLPSIMHEARIGRDMEFRRQVWLRSAQPGAAPPAELVASNAAAPPAQTRQPNPTQPQPGAPPDVGQLTNALIQTICHGFDTDPEMGQETAATIALLYGRQVVALGFDKYLSDPVTLTEYVKGIPALAQRSQFATWQRFQDDFLDYCIDKWGESEPADEPQKPGPQSVA